jgi:hypothetical protein
MAARFPVRVAAAVLLAAAVAGAREEPAPPAPPAAAVPTDIDALADEMTAAVESVRGLRFRSPVERRTRPRSAVIEEFRPRSRKRKGRGPSGETRALRFFGLLESKAPPGKAGDDGPDASETEARFRAESVGGYYSARDKVFTLVEGDGGSLNRMIVFHELIHALEDQHYDYRGAEKPLGEAGRSDRVRAYRALVEGSAQYHTDLWVDAEPGRRSKVMEEVMVREGWKGPSRKAAPDPTGATPDPDPPAGAGDPPAGGDGDEGGGGDGGEDGNGDPESPPRSPGDRPSPDDQPAYLMIREVMFPYHNGKLFLESVLAALPAVEPGTDPLARLFADPPASSEQILHPEKYVGAPDLPREVLLPDLGPILGEGWTKAAEDTQGELGTGIAMNRWLYPKATPLQLMAVLRPPPGGFRKIEDLMNTPMIFRGTSGTATEGWDGDRWGLWSNGEREALGWVLLFDSERDAGEFAEGYAKVLRRKYRGSVRGEDGVWTGTGGGSTAVAVAGDRVVVAERVPPGSLSAVVEELRAAAVERDPRDAVPAAAAVPGAPADPPK